MSDGREFLQTIGVYMFALVWPTTVATAQMDQSEFFIWGYTEV